MNERARRWPDWPPRIAVVLPTVTGRADELADAVEEFSPAAWLLLVLRDRPTCGEAWNEGVALALAGGAEYVCLAADDLRPTSAGWWVHAVTTCDRGQLPAPLLFNVDGTRWDADGEPGAPYAFSRVPFLSAAQARELFPIPPLHYYSDCAVGTLANASGWLTIVTAGYAFVHTWAEPGRVHDSEPDRIAYERWAATL